MRVGTGRRIAAVGAALAVLVGVATASSVLAAPGGAARVVTIGDSIMAGFGLDPGQAWPEVIASEDHVAVDDLGCSGAGFVVPGVCGTDFSGLVGRAVAARPRLVIIESSDNDLGQSESGLAAATTATVSALHRAVPSATIVGLSTLWDQPETAPEEIAAGSADLRRAVAGVGGLYVDLGDPLRGDPALLQTDAEHPTAAGQQVLSRAVRAGLIGVGIEI